MITSALFLLGGGIIAMFVYILSALNWSFPSGIITAYQTLFSVIHTFSAFLPFIGDAIAIFLVIAPVAVIRYILELILFVWSLIPWIGSRTYVPNAPKQSQVKRDMANKRFYQ